MPIRFVGNQGLQTNHDTQPGGQATCSFSAWVKIANTDHQSKVIFGKEFTTPFCLLPSSVVSGNLPMRLILTINGSVIDGRPVLIPGVWYHLAGSYDGSIARFYSNNSQVSSSFATGALSAGNQKWQIGAMGGTFDLLMADICFWNGYVLTSADVLALMKKTKAPTEIGTASQRRICWSLSGPADTPVTIGSAGITGGMIGAATTLIGAPTYSGEVHQYTPPAKVRASYVGESRSTIVFTFETQAGNATTLSSISSHPSVTIDGVTTQLGTPPPLRTSQYAMYLLPFSVPIGSTLTATAPESWATTAAGAVGALESAPVSTADTPMFERATVAPKTMKLGVNIRGPEYWDPLPVYANLAKQGSSYTGVASGNPTYTLDADDYPVTLSGGEIGFGIANFLGSGLGSPDKGYPNLEPGQYTLMWDGADQARLYTGGPNGLGQVSYNRTMGLDNTRVYNNVAATDGSNYGTLSVAMTGPDVRNIRVFGPGTPTGGGGPRFSPGFMDRLGSPGAIRFLDALEVNNSNISRFSRFTKRSMRSYGSTKYGSGATATTVSNFAGPPSSYFGSSQAFVVNTATPHGFTTGEVVAFTNPLDTIKLTDTTSFAVPNNHNSHILVLSPTSFAASLYTGSTKTVASGQFRASVSVSYAGTMPLEDMAEMCSEAMADLWICVPHALPDADVRQMAAVIAERLPSGLKAYVEYSNECWHYAYSFQQTAYCDGQGAAVGLNGRQWYTRRSAQVHAIFTEEFARLGRPYEDVVRVFASQSANSGITQAILEHAALNSYPVDVLAVAPYYQVTPSGFASTYDAMTIDQLMDAAALAVATYPLAELAPHTALIAQYTPGASLVCYEMATELWIGGGSNVTNAATKSRWASRHPRAYEIVLKYLQNQQDAGVVMSCWFELNMYAGTWGPYSYGATWGLYPAGWPMWPGKGDGSDGLFDNRTGYDDLMNIVSPMGLAVETWQVWSRMGPGPVDPPAEALLDAWMIP